MIKLTKGILFLGVIGIASTVGLGFKSIIKPTDQNSGSTFSTSNGIECTETPKLQNKVEISIQKEQRVIKTNSIPDHAIGAFPNPNNPHTMSEQWRTYKVPANPEKTGKLISVYSREGFGQGMPQYEFGVAINGINMEPSALEAFENPKTGERNFDWTKEALSTTVKLGDDCNNAHVQPNGKYHYHGTPRGITSKADGSSMFLTGWAADGFPIYYKYGYQDPKDSSSPIVELRSSYRLKAGQRPGDGVSEPNGNYDGTYVRDFEYQESAGNLDEANGRFGVTPEFPDGTYYYVITDEFPSIPRYFVGSPSDDFKLGGERRRGHPRRPPHHMRRGMVK